MSRGSMVPVCACLHVCVYHLCPTDLSPDLVILNNTKRAVFLIELTCPCSNQLGKTPVTRYHDLASTAMAGQMEFIAPCGQYR